jgi:hypothetical protein
VVAEIEATLLPLVDAALDEGIATYMPVDDPDWVDATFDLDLALDFTAPGVGAPNGGLTLTTTITDLRLELYRYGFWWQPECLFRVDVPETLAMDTTLLPSAGWLPASPVAPGPATEDWSLATADTEVAPGYSWLCNNYLVNGGLDWAGYSDVYDPSSPAGVVQELLVTGLGGLVDQVWDDNVWPVIGSLATLAGFDVDVAQLRADDDGLVVTADVDATAGVTVAGWGPYPVGSAVDAGVTSNVDVLLARRDLGGVPSDIIVTLHPNVTNQYLTAVHDRRNGDLGTTAVGSAVATALVDPVLGTCYLPGGWSTRLEAQAPPHLTPTGPFGAPEMQLPQTTVQLRNAGCLPADPRVATFTGSLDDVAVTTVGTPLGPRGAAATAAWTATRTQADAATAARVPPATAATLLPWAQGALATFLALHVPGHVDLTVAGFPGHGATHCDTCARYPSDQRITETFHVS